MCVHRLEEKTAEFEKKGMHVSRIHSVSEPLRLGHLQGNHFDLVVRDLRPHRVGDSPPPLAALVKEAVENVEVSSSKLWQLKEPRLTYPCMAASPWSGSCLQNRGFVNYYGPQRFGSGQSVLSDRVGLALLKEDFVGAADEADVCRGSSVGSMSVCFALQVGAVRLFFTPEEGHDPPSLAKRHFLQTGEDFFATRREKKKKFFTSLVFLPRRQIMPRNLWR